MSLRPFMIGTEEFSENFICVPWSSVLRTMQSNIELNTLAVSSTGSPRPSCRSFTERKLALPPSCVMATSNETLVLVEDFSKIRPRNFPSRDLEGVFWLFNSKELFSTLSRSFNEKLFRSKK